MKLVCSFIGLIVFITVQAQDFGMSEDFETPKGLEAGTEAPLFKGIDQNGKEIDLKNLLTKGPVVLMFYRGYWCGQCNKHLGAFQESLSLILDKRAAVVAVTPENNDGIEKTVEKNAITFSVLSDPDYSIMDAYNVRFLVTEQYNNKIRTFKGIGIDENNSDDKPYLPVPATFIIGKDGNILKVWFDENYRNRPSAEEIAKHL